MGSRFRSGGLWALTSSNELPGAANVGAPAQLNKPDPRPSEAGDVLCSGGQGVRDRLR